MSSTGNHRHSSLLNDKASSRSSKASTRQRSGRPSSRVGWTPLGLIEHLVHAERFWFRYVQTGQVSDLPWPTLETEEEDWPFAGKRPADAVLVFYRDQCARPDAVLSSVTLHAEPRGQIPAEMADLSRSVRTIMLHLIEETAP